MYPLDPVTGALKPHPKKEDAPTATAGAGLIELAAIKRQALEFEMSKAAPATKTEQCRTVCFARYPNVTTGYLVNVVVTETVSEHLRRLFVLKPPGWI